MTRLPTLVAVFCAAAVLALCLTVAASSAPAATGPACTALAAKAGILSSNLPRKVKMDATGRYGAGIDRLICRDLTGDGRKDMVASIFSGGAGVEAWVVFQATSKGWKLVFRRLHLYKVGIRSVPAGIVEIDPVYAPDGHDPNCCPSRGYDHTLYRWKAGTFVVGRTWHTRKP